MKSTCLSFLLLASLPCMAFEPPTMGWSSWNTYGININEELIKSQTDAMVLMGLSGVGYKYINIDDGYFGGRDAGGNLYTHPTKFPNGMRPLVDYIHGRGLKAGIYSDAGDNTCASNHGDTFGLGVGLYQHDQQDMDLFFKQWNFDFIKVDYCGGTRLNLDEQIRYREIAEALRRTGCEDVRMNVCRWNYPGTWVHDICASWRISHDIKNNWGSVADIIQQSLYLSAYAYDGKYNDMDMLEVGRSLTEEEDKTHFGIWCMMSSPLLIGCDMTTLKGKALELLKNEELIGLNQDVLGLQAYVVKKVSGAYILVKDIRTLYGNTRALAVYNPADTATNVVVNFNDLDLAGKVQVRDVYTHSNMGLFSSSFKVSVPAHGTRIYALEAEKRVERTLYEGETGYISDYQELVNNKTARTAIYSEGDIYSGGAVVKYLGYSEQNDLVWRNVYSEEGGDYEMTLQYLSGEDRYVFLSINGEQITTMTLNSGAYTTPGIVTIPIRLIKGNNQVRLYNPTYWMPDIDCMRLAKVNANALDAVKTDPNQASSIYSIEGILLKEKARGNQLPESLSKGVYIVGGKKVVK